MTKNKQINIAIAGLGTVGQGVVKILQEHQELLSKRTGAIINIVAVSARDKGKDRGLSLDGVQWCENAIDLADVAEAEIVVELIGGATGIAKDLCEKALKAGKDVVTANKAMIAEHGFALAKLAEENNCQLLFDAAVAGGIPVIKNLKESLAGNQVSKISGILNGTCNFILTKMADERKGFDEVLKTAQELGYAEADPSFDVGGIDASHKIVILTAIAFGVKPSLEDIYIEGIEKITLKDIDYAKKFGFNVRLLANCEADESGNITQRTHPCLVSDQSDIGRISGVLGAVKIKSDALGNFLMTGAGAGMMETASSVVGDIADIAAGRESNAFGISSNDLAEGKFKSINEHKCEFYLRLTVKDVDGVFSSISNILSENKVGFEKVNQDVTADDVADIVIITHVVSEKSIRSSLEKLKNQDYLLEEPIMIRVEK